MTETLETMRRVNSHEYCQKHYDNSEYTKWRDIVFVYETRQKDCHGLSKRHYYRENYSAEFGDCVEYKQLADGGAN